MITFNNKIFVITNNKKVPQHKWKNPEDRLTYKQVQKHSNFVLIPPKQYIVIDCDNDIAVKNVEYVLKQLRIKTFSYDTSRGKHFLFKLPLNSKFFENLGSHANVSYFQSKENGSGIDIKGNDKGYVMVKQNDKERTNLEIMFQEWEKAPLLPITLANKSRNMFLNDYVKNGRDETLFRYWLPELKKQNITQEEFVKFCVELKLIAKDKETIDETISWSNIKWESSKNLPTLDIWKKTNNTTTSVKKSFTYKTFQTKEELKNNEEPKIFQAVAIKDFVFLSDVLIEENKLCMSQVDNQIWGMQDGLFTPIVDIKLYVKQIIFKHPDFPKNIHPQIFSNITSYLIGRIPMYKFENNLFLVKFNNAIIDVLKKEKIEEHKNYLNPNQIPHNFIGFKINGFEKEKHFLNAMMNGWSSGNKKVEQELYELIGACLIKYRGFEKAYFLLGIGKNGKGFFLDFLNDILGENNVAHEDLKDLSDKDFSIVNLYGKLANIESDISSDSIHNTSMFKKITSGDTISASWKHQNKFSFKPYALQVYATNDIPYAYERGDSNAINRRLKIIKFNNVFKEVKEVERIKQKKMLHNQKVIEICISRSINAIHKALHNGFTISPLSKIVFENHKKNMNHLYDFVSETPVHNNIPIMEVYKQYSVWCIKNEYNKLKRLEFEKKYINVVRSELGLEMFKSIDNSTKGENRYHFKFDDSKIVDYINNEKDQGETYDL